MTLAQWVTALAALDVVGVKREFASPPQQINAADMPLSYPRLPANTDEVATFSGAMGLTAAEIELVIVICPAMLSSASVEFARTIALIDALRTTLVNATVSLGIDRFTIRQEKIIDAGSDTAYWGIVASVEASF